MTHYAGIGSRSTPATILDRMKRTAYALDVLGHTLRSGGASGADRAFEDGVVSKRKEIFLPWWCFNASPSTLHLQNPSLPTQAAMTLAEQFHPNWSACTERARLLHARNVFIVLGANLNSPVSFVICWTPGGRDVGGTAQALRIARAFNIPIHNLGSL